jgi:hypothetical protein
VSYSGEVMQDGPSAYWHLGEVSGTQAADATANGRHGTWSGSPALGAAGALDSDADASALLDGVDDKVSLPALPAIDTTLTLEFWFKPQSGGDATECIVGEAGGGKSVLFKTASSKLSVFYSSTDHLSGTPIALDTWHHVAIVVEGGAGTFYVNGAADGTFASFPAGFAPDRIGDDNAGNTYKGYLDEVALYLAALPAARVAAHYAAAWRGLLGLRPRLRRELRDDDTATSAGPTPSSTATCCAPPASFLRPGRTSARRRSSRPPAPATSRSRRWTSWCESKPSNTRRDSGRRAMCSSRPGARP